MKGEKCSLCGSERIEYICFCGRRGKIYYKCKNCDLVVGVGRGDADDDCEMLLPFIGGEEVYGIFFP